MNAIATLTQSHARNAGAEGGRHADLQRVLRRSGLDLRCRNAALAGALLRFRERQAEINSGGRVTLITMSAAAAPAWLAAA